ncbi:MAG TPA: DUF4446 family protein [bacterium]|nr:DUF4446 family protein [bacterium]
MHQRDGFRRDRTRSSDVGKRGNDGLNILRDASPDTVAYVLLGAACVAVIVFIVLLARSRPAKPAQLLTPDEAVQRQFAALTMRLDALEQSIAQINAALPSTVQSVSVVRFSPFPEMGGNMSFSMALLDAKANGIVISVLNDRQGSRIYGKSVEGGVSPQKLSEEEQQAIGLARGRKA